MPSDWHTPQLETLCDALLSLRTREEAAAFLRDVCTVAELEALGHRLAAARLIDEGVPYAEVARRVGGSTTTVTRVAHWLRHGEGGYRTVLDRTAGDRSGATGTPTVRAQAAAGGRP